MQRDNCLKCVLECDTEHPKSKFGEEDMTICEEKCYENFFYKMQEIKSDLNNIYQSIYLQKYQDN